MGKKRKKTSEKVKVVYRPTVAPRSDEIKEARTDIEKLEAKRATIGKGWKGFLAKAALNKQISEKRGVISARDQLRTTKAQTELGKALLEKEKVKLEFQALKKKSSVNFDDLYKSAGY